MTRYFAFLNIFALFALSSCQEGPNQHQQNQQNQVSTCSVQLNSKTIRVVREKGKPQTLTTKLPASKGYCFVVRTDASSAVINLDSEKMIGPERFKNKQQTFKHIQQQLELKPHELSVEVRGKPGSYVEIDVFYNSSQLDEQPGIQSEQEAAILGQAWIEHKAKDIGSVSHWKDASVGRITPAYTTDGTLTAYVLDLVDAQGHDVGGVVLEKEPQRSLLGSANLTAPSFTNALAQLYEGRYNQKIDAPGNKVQYLWNWVSFGLLVAKVTLPSGEIRLVNECPQCDVSFGDADRWPVDSPEQSKANRQVLEKTLLQSLSFQTQSSSLCDAAKADEKNKCSKIVYNNSKHVKCSYESYSTDHGVSCDLPAFPDYYQYTDMWPDPTVEDIGEATCYVGCVPIAWAQLLEFWKRRGYKYVAPAGVHDVTGEIVNDELKSIRRNLETRCNDDSGSTKPENNSKIIDYIDSAPGVKSHAGFSLGWTTEQTWANTKKFRLEVFGKLVEFIDKEQPQILGYLSTWRDVEDFEGLTTNHAVVVYGYYDDPEDVEDLYVVRTGWEKTKSRIEPLWGTGWIRLEELNPPQCSTLEAPYCKTYPDVSESYWGHTSIQTLTCNCVVQGYHTGEFGPNDSLSKVQFIKIVMKMAFPDKSFEKTKVKNIGDIDEKHWGSGYVQFADELGILEALLNDDRELAPDSSIRRYQAAYLISRVGQHTNQGEFSDLYNMRKCVNSSTDADTYSDYGPGLTAWSDTVAGAKLCIWEGFDGEFKPNDYLTRAQGSKVACMAMYGYGSPQCGASNSNCVVQTCNR